MAAESSKRCGHCKKTKLVIEFNKDPSTPTGLFCWCKECENEKRRQYYLAGQGADQARKRRLKRNYNMTIERYDQMFEEQDGVCVICEKPETHKNQYGIRRLSVDHNHKTGKIRGLLCNQCNRLLGNARDDADILENAAQYLRNSQ